jgi:hypothetical protein
MLKTESGRLNNYEGPGKVKINSDIDCDRYWLTRSRYKNSHHAQRPHASVDLPRRYGLDVKTRIRVLL